MPCCECRDEAPNDLQPMIKWAWILKVWAATTIALVTLVSYTAAQDDVNEQIWLDYHQHFYLNPKWEFYGDTGFRFLASGWDWQTLYTRPSFRYHSPRGPFEGHGGLGLFYKHRETTSNQFELLPWLGAFIKWPRFERLTITHYLRLEGRFVHDSDEGSFDETLRFRYKIGTKIPLNRLANLKYFYFPLSVEWFEDVGPKIDEVFASQWRFYLGVGYVFSNEWVGEFHFILQRSRSTPSQPLETSDNIFRITIKRLWSTRDYMSRES